MSRNLRFEFAVTGREPVQVFNGDQGMFVHGIAVVIVANHQRVDGLKFGEQQVKQAEPVHGAQRSRRVRHDQNLAERLPQVRNGREPLLNSREGRFHRVFGFSR